jgi:hypothetical protein
VTFRVVGPGPRGARGCGSVVFVPLPSARSRACCSCSEERIARALRLRAGRRSRSRHSRDSWARADRPARLLAAREEAVGRARAWRAIWRWQSAHVGATHTAKASPTSTVARSEGQESARRHPQTRTATSGSESEHGEDGEDAEDATMRRSEHDGILCRTMGWRKPRLQLINLPGCVPPHHISSRSERVSIPSRAGASRSERVSIPSRAGASRSERVSIPSHAAPATARLGASCRTVARLRESHVSPPTMIMPAAKDLDSVREQSPRDRESAPTNRHLPTR